MALSDKNIIITPNIGQAADPKIQFIGADSSTGAQTITLNVYPTSGGMLSFEGSSGQLFSITNSLTGTIYSVTDISGVPSIEVLDSGLVKLAQYNGNVLIGTGTNIGSRLHISSGTPSGVGAMPSGVVTTQSSSGNNYLLFRNTADNGTYAGLAFQDNNIGGYVIFGNAGGGGDLLYVAGYGGGQLQYGSADSISPGSRTTVASWNGTGLQVNSGDFRTPFIYDSNDTGYYLDPNSMSRMSRVDPDEIYNYGWFRNHYSGKGLYNQTNGTHFYSNGGAAWAITGSGGNVELQFRSNHESTMRGYVYANTGGSIGFLDYNGNWRIRGDGANVELYGGTYIDNAYAYVLYDRSDTGYYVDPTGTSNLNVAKAVYFCGNAGNAYGQYKGYDNNNHFIIIRGNVGGTTSSPSLSGAHQTTLVEYAEGNDSTGWFFKTSATGNYDLVSRITRSYSYFEASARSPIFYDSDNTAFYCDPSSTTRLSGLIVGYGSASSTIDMYDSDESTRYIHNNSSTIGFLGSHGSWRFRMADDGNLVMGTYQAWLSDQIRSGIYYEHSDTGYYCDPASSSRLDWVHANGLRTYSNLYIDGDYGRTVVGVYSSYRYQGVFAMGDSYKLPADGTTTGSLYGIAWSHPNAGGVAANLNTHGMLVMENGGFLAAVSGSIRCRDDMRAPIFYDSNDTGYYLNPNGGSYLNSLILAGGAYFRPQNWIQLDSTYGMYWPNHYGAHLHANDLSTYTQLAIRGSKNSYGGMYDQYSGVNGMMYDSSGNGGIYREGTGRWYLYHSVGNNCMGVGTSGTSASHGIYVVKGGYFDGRVDATIYYDAADTGYYLDPNGTSNLSTTITGYAYFRSNRNTSSDSPPLQAYSNDGGGAIMSFHRGGYYAVNFGLDSDNVIRIGGWSASTNRLQMDMSGNLTMAGNVTAYSDERLKKDWALLPDDYVERLAQIKSGTYTRIDSGERQVGVSAQDFQLLLTEAVSEDNSGMLSVSYGNAALASSVELAKRIIKQQAEIDELKALVAQLLAK